MEEQRRGLKLSIKGEAKSYYRNTYESIPNVIRNAHQY